jgi:hypothetical protein
MVAVVKKSGTEEQKRSLAFAVKESSEKTDYLEQSRSEWKTLPVARNMTSLAADKQVLMSRMG